MLRCAGDVCLSETSAVPIAELCVISSLSMLVEDARGDMDEAYLGPLHRFSVSNSSCSLMLCASTVIPVMCLLYACI